MFNKFIIRHQRKVKTLKKYVDNFKLIHIKKYLSTKKPQMIQVCGFTKHYENHCLNTK